jgi:glyoxylase-like metal-dependent hydrolase (beta-lactamase superfamily II)
LKPFILAVALATAMSAAAQPATAQSSQPAAPAQPAAPSPPPLPPLTTEQLGPGFHVLLGDIGNVAVSSGPDGVLIVDTLVPRAAEQIKAAVAAFSDQPIRFVVDTHWHRDHTGANMGLGRDGAVIVAHDNVRRRMGAEQFMRGYNVKIPPSPPAALPAVTFSGTMTFNLNGETIRAIHVPNAHTDGDVIVHFVNANAIHMGDTFFNGILPYIDVNNGGSVQGMIRAVETALALADDRTRIIPAHGPVSDKRGLAAYGAMLRDVTARIQAGIRAHRSLADIVASKPAAAYQASYQGDMDGFVGWVYDSLDGDGPAPTK